MGKILFRGLNVFLVFIAGGTVFLSLFNYQHFNDSDALVNAILGCIFALLFSWQAIKE